MSGKKNRLQKEEHGYPKRPSKDWYTRSPLATEASKDRFRIISTVVKAVETFMFAPLNEEYIPGSEIHLAMRYYLLPNSQPQRFPSSEEARQQMTLAFGMLPRIAGLRNDKIPPHIRELADRSIGTMPLNNVQTGEWAQYKEANLGPEEVLQLMGIKLHVHLKDNPVFNFWENRDLLAVSADFLLKSRKKDGEVFGYLYQAETGETKKTPARVEARNFMATVLLLRIVNYFLGEPPLHQTMIDPRIDDRNRRKLRR